MSLVELIRNEIPEFGTDEPLPGDFMEKYAKALNEGITAAIEQRTDSPSGAELFDYGRADYITFWNRVITHPDRYALIRPAYMKLFCRDVELQLSDNPELIKMFRLVRPDIRINLKDRKYELQYGYPISEGFKGMHEEINKLLVKNGFDATKIQSMFKNLEGKLLDVHKQWLSKFKSYCANVKEDFNKAYAHNEGDASKPFGNMDPIGQLEVLFTDSFNIISPLFNEVAMNADPEVYL